MQALASVSRQEWRSNGIHAVAIERAEARTRRRQPKHHCPRCGEKNHLRARFCNHCGARLDEIIDLFRSAWRDDPST